MTSLGVSRVRDSPFRESEWDRRLDDMLEDLGGGGAVAMLPGGGGGVSQQVSSQHHSSYSYSSSSQLQQHQQVRMQSSSSSQHASSVTNGGRTATNNFSVSKSASAAAAGNNADDVLKDLETGLKKSTSYISESHRAWEGPEGRQEWREVRRAGDQGDYSLEQQVQHMIGGMEVDSHSQSVSQQQQQQQYSAQQQQQQLTTYKVQSNQYGAAGERLTSPHQLLPDCEEADRPASRLKQNIDDLDTLLYDLNHAQHEPGPQEYGGPGTVDSDDYDETVGHEGHVKRTVQAFNEFSQQTTAATSSKPPSPAPRRRTQPSPAPARRTPTSPQPPAQAQARQQQWSYTSQQQQQQASSRWESSGQEQEVEQPSYYAKYSASPAPRSPPPQPQPPPTSVAFPQHAPRAQTPQMPPKRVEELMSEFQEFECGGGSSGPASSFPRAGVEVTELADGPHHVTLDPEPQVREVSPPPARTANTKGPDVYYPPGAEFTKSVQASHPVADGGSMSLQEKGRGERRRQERGHERGQEGGDKQGAAVIPICLPLCCAAPCVIM